MSRDHLMGYPEAARWSADAEKPEVKRIRLKPRPAPAPVALPTLADYLPTGVTQCTNKDRQGISRNLEIRAVRFRGVLIEFDHCLGQVMRGVIGYDLASGHDTCDC